VSLSRYLGHYLSRDILVAVHGCRYTPPPRCTCPPCKAGNSHCRHILHETAHSWLRWVLKDIVKKEWFTPMVPGHEKSGLELEGALFSGQRMVYFGHKSAQPLRPRPRYLVGAIQRYVLFLPTALQVIGTSSLTANFRPIRKGFRFALT
jgi:hypothetical protein